MAPSSIPPYMIHVQDLNALPPDVFAKSYLAPESSLLSFSTSKKVAHDNTAAQPTDYSPSQIEHVEIELQSASQVHKSDFKACFDLVVETSIEDYRRSSRGWKPRAKWKEMAEPDMRYLLVRKQEQDGPEETQNLPLAFLSFMITIEDAQPVLYIYELHTAQEARRKGLGAHLIKIAEHIAAQTKMECCMLTVFRSNKGARRFYTSCGYNLDVSSPGDKILRGGKVKKCDYLILSKITKQKENVRQTEARKQSTLDDWEDEDI